MKPKAWMVVFFKTQNMLKKKRTVILELMPTATTIRFSVQLKYSILAEFRSSNPHPKM